MKQRTKALWAKVLVGVFAFSFVGGLIPLIETENRADAATETRVVKPYIEYTFDNAQNF